MIFWDDSVDMVHLRLYMQHHVSHEPKEGGVQRNRRQGAFARWPRILRRRRLDTDHVQTTRDAVVEDRGEALRPRTAFQNLGTQGFVPIDRLGR